MPAFLKLSLQQKVAAQVAADLGAAADWTPRAGSAELLRGEGRRYFGKKESPLFRNSAVLVRRRSFGGL